MKNACGQGLRGDAHREEELRRPAWRHFAEIVELASSWNWITAEFTAIGGLERVTHKAPIDRPDSRVMQIARRVRLGASPQPSGLSPRLDHKSASQHGARTSNRTYGRICRPGSDYPSRRRSYRERLAWYWARTAKMDTREIVHRLVEGATKQFSRRLHARLGRHQADRPTSVVARHCRPHAQLSARSRRRDSPRSGGCQSRADSICSAPMAGTRSHAPSSRAFWHIDPDDGEVFPQRDAYCFDVSFRHGVNTREIKRIWELSRLQFLVPLAAYAALLATGRSLSLVVGLVRSWMEGNPPFRGLNWSSGIELALRVISVALCLSMIGVERLDEESRQAILQIFFAHVYWLKRFPSLHSSANNHRIAELAGLIVGTDDGAGHVRGADDVREEELARSAHRDRSPDLPGRSGCRASAHLYRIRHRVVLGRSRLPAENSTTCRRPPKDRLAAWAEHSLWLMDTEARVPQSAIADDCRVIATTQAREPRYVASIVSAVASCIGRPDLAPPRTDPSIRDVLLGSVERVVEQRTGCARSRQEVIR